MSNDVQEMTVYDEIRLAEKVHLAFLSVCVLFVILPCVFPDFLIGLFGSVLPTKYAKLLLSVIAVLPIVIAIIHCKNHKKTRERLLSEKRELEAKAEMADD